MTMLERMARAMCDVRHAAPYWDEAREELRETIREEARAALEVLKEPSEGMKQHALRDGGCPALPVDEWEALQAFWTAMIDAVLEGRA